MYNYPTPSLAVSYLNSSVIKAAFGSQFGKFGAHRKRCQFATARSSAFTQWHMVCHLRRRSQEAHQKFGKPLVLLVVVPHWICTRE